MQGRTPHVVLALHEEYGDIVRIGPNELSIRNLDAAQTILIKGNLRKGTSIHCVRSELLTLVDSGMV